MERKQAVSSGTAKASPTFDALEDKWIGFGSRVTDTFELSKILLRPLPSTKRKEAGLETLDKITEMGCVGRRIRELAGMERATSPIRPLVLLVEVDPDLLFEQGGEAGLLLTEQLRHDLSVLETGDPDLIISIEDPDVVVRAMH